MNCFEMSIYADIQEKKAKEFDGRFGTPAFAVLSAGNSNSFNAAIIYDHDFNPIRKSTFQTAAVNMSEFDHTAGKLKATQTNSSSRNDVGSGTAISGHLGHAILNVEIDEGVNVGTRSKTRASAQRDVGTISNSTKPDLAIFMDEDKYWIGPRKMSTTPDSRMGHATGLPVVGTGLKNGSIGFNDKTGQLAILESNAAFSKVRLVTWENLSSPQEFNTSEDFFTQAGITTALALTTSWFDTPQKNMSYTEDKRRAVVVVCDNGTIVCSKMYPHHGFGTFEIVKTAGAYVAPTANVFWHHWTTTYGCEQGDLFGIKHRVTLDGKYIVAYAPTYYYGSGIAMSVTRVSDGKVLSHYSRDSTYGFSVLPIRASDFILIWASNSDSEKGVRFYELDMENQFETKATGDTLVIGTVITNIIDSGYYSTNYPIVVPMMGSDLDVFKAGESE